ncbi:MAG TPA: hypothetical protein VF589_07820 [Allosphingosinicella sp.]|jgi:hypothetical protein
MDDDPDASLEPGDAISGCLLRLLAFVGLLAIVFAVVAYWGYMRSVERTLGPHTERRAPRL